MKNKSPQKTKKKPVNARVYKSVNNCPQFPPKRLFGVLQKDLTLTSFFDEERKLEMVNCSREGKGQPFWTTRERTMFHQRFYNTYIKKGKKIAMKRVQQFAEQLADEYNCFRIALKDKKLIRSLYYCLNNLSRNRKYIKLAESWEEIDFGPLANMEVVQYNCSYYARRI